MTNCPGWGGPGSGSVKGKKATNYKDGRWSTLEKLRERAKASGKDLVAGHKVAAVRDKKNRNIVGPASKVNEMRNVRLISRSQNAKEAKRGKKSR